MITPPPPPPPPPELGAGVTGATGATGAGVTGALLAAALEDDGLAAGAAGVTTGLGLGLGWRSAGSGTLASGGLITAADEAGAFNGTGPGALCVLLEALALPSARAAPNSASTSSSIARGRTGERSVSDMCVAAFSIPVPCRKSAS
jgi:hypothetical protein